MGCLSIIIQIWLFTKNRKVYSKVNWPTDLFESPTPGTTNMNPCIELGGPTARAYYSILFRVSEKGGKKNIQNKKKKLGRLPITPFETRVILDVIVPA